jgi:hypothetical protein
MISTKPIRAPRGRQVVAGLAVLILSAGCGGSASLAPTPMSTPAATATAPAAPATTPSATSPTGQMTHGRSTHTAMELADGRVLVAGGYFNRYPITAADLYSPATDTFAATGQTATARGFDTATLLPDGRVLIAGGYDGRADVTTAELYDATTGTFRPNGPGG